MSNFINDTLANQIERGEVFLASLQIELAPQLTASTTFSETYRILTGAYETSLRLEIAGLTTCSIVVAEGMVYSAPGTPVPLINMNFNSSNTISATVFVDPTVSVGGTTKFISYRLLDNLVKLSPFDVESGIILKPSTEYQFVITNLGSNTDDYAVTTYLRELK